MKTCYRCGREGSRGFVDESGKWRCHRVEACQYRELANQRAANAGRCVDCVAEGITNKRTMATKSDGSLQPGPRCVTHWRARRKATSLAAHGKRTEATYEISAEEYWAIYEFQGGRCALCRLATGKARRLAVDHDHELAKTHDHPVDQGCRLCIRGLLCKRCNRFGVPLVLAIIIRTINYLCDPPARKVLTPP